MQRHHLAATAAIFLLGCPFDTAPEAIADESSSSDGSDDDDGHGTVTVNTMLTSASESDSDSESSDSASSDDGSSEDESGDDSSGSTGDPIEDWALHFGGDTVANKDNNGGAYGWSAEAWTVEAWIDIEDTSARGILFESEDAALTTGWVLYLHTDFNALTFSFFDATNANQVVIGPSIEDIGIGWHHIAATNSGEGTVYIHVDGVPMAAEEVSTSVATDNVVQWKIGGNVVGNPDLNLRHVAIDDLRITESPLYSGPFDPPVVFETNDATALLLNFDEGKGVVTQDTEASFIGFAIENPAWVAGNGD